MKELYKNIELSLRGRLAEYGFKKGKVYEFTYQVSDAIVQEVGIVKATYGQKHVCYLAPSMSVCYSKAAALLEKLAVYYISSVALNVGYLMPEDNYKQWKFALGQDIAPEVDSMAEAIIQYGIPYLNELSDETNLIEVFDKPLYHIGFKTKSYLVPVIYFYRGEKKLALQSLEQFIEEYHVSFIRYCERLKVEQHLSDTRDVVDKDLLNYMAFVENFRRFIASS